MKKILVVEDERLVANLLQRKLADEGYYAFIAGDGEKALEETKKRRPDLLLLDIILPRLNGLEVLQQIRNDPRIKTTPVIIISNSGQPAEIERAKQLGASDWLVKTEFDPEEVVRKVQEQIGPGDEIKARDEEEQ